MLFCGCGRRRDSASRLRTTVQSWTVLAYMVPLPLVNTVGFLIDVFAMKFATDSLGISPGAMGTVFSISRVCDAFTDPVVGYLSDATTAPLGRRRSWMLAGCLPMAALFFAIFSPPRNLSSDGLLMWEGLAIIGYFASSSCFNVPHVSLGAELTVGRPPSERSRLFGIRHVLSIVGQLGGIVALYFLLSAQVRGREYVMPLASSVSLAVGVSFVGGVVFSVCNLRERTQAVLKQPNVKETAQRVLSNPHARLLSLAYFIEEAGKGVFGLMAPYFLQYVCGMNPSIASFVMVVYMVSATLSPPLSLPCRRHCHCHPHLFPPPPQSSPSHTASAHFCPLPRF